MWPKLSIVLGVRGIMFELNRCDVTRPCVLRGHSEHQVSLYPVQLCFKSFLIKNIFLIYKIIMCKYICLFLFSEQGHLVNPYKVHPHSPIHLAAFRESLCL